MELASLSGLLSIIFLLQIIGFIQHQELQMGDILSTFKAPEVRIRHLRGVYLHC